MIEIKRVPLEPNRRILAISDIHADYVSLKELLHKVNFNNQDYLFILGDIVEKGKNSLETLRYVMNLAKQPNVFVLMGNCDYIPISLRNNGHYPVREYFMSHYYTFINEMCRNHNIELHLGDDFKPIIDKLYNTYKEEFDFIAKLPHVIETDKIIFAHGGIDPMLRDDYLDPKEIMKWDSFIDSTDFTFNKYLVVGHTPTINYCEKIPSYNPYYVNERNIIAIDGGNVIKESGQLNCLIYTPSDGKFHHEYVDHLPEIMVIRDYLPIQENSTLFTWFDDEIRIIHDKGEICTCEHVSDGYIMDIPRIEIFKHDGHLAACDVTDYHIPVYQGEKISLVYKLSEISYVKKNGCLGWVSNVCLAYPENIK